MCLGALAALAITFVIIVSQTLLHRECCSLLPVLNSLLMLRNVQNVVVVGIDTIGAHLIGSSVCMRKNSGEWYA